VRRGLKFIVRLVALAVTLFFALVGLAGIYGLFFSVLPPFKAVAVALIGFGISALNIWPAIRTIRDKVGRPVTAST
jgi:hypothetical protein